LSCVSPHFYTYNVEILLTGSDLGIPQRQNFVRIAQGILLKACQYCITSEVTHISISSYISVFGDACHIVSYSIEEILWFFVDHKLLNTVTLQQLNNAYRLQVHNLTVNNVSCQQIGKGCNQRHIASN